VRTNLSTADPLDRHRRLTWWVVGPVGIEPTTRGFCGRTRPLVTVAS